MTVAPVSPLYDTLCSFENLLRAARDAARGKRGHPDVAEFDYHLEGRLLSLRRQLLTHTYRPGAYRRYTIREPKERRISAAPFTDRVVHHALVNILEPLFERRFIGDSYASRTGKGIHKALDRATTFACRYPYVLRCDISWRAARRSWWITIRPSPSPSTPTRRFHAHAAYRNSNAPDNRNENLGFRLVLAAHDSRGSASTPAWARSYAHRRRGRYAS